jgi:hypothetical protein
LVPIKSLSRALRKRDPAVADIKIMQTSFVNSMEVPVVADTVKTRRLSGKRAAVIVLGGYTPRVRRSAEALAEEGMSVELICAFRSSTAVAERHGTCSIT